MGEKIKKIDQPVIQKVSAGTAWLAEAIGTAQKEQLITTEQATRLIFSRILTELKSIETGSSKLKMESGDNLENQMDKVAKLHIVTKQMLGSRIENLKKLAESNKFRLLEKAVVSDTEINEEKVKYQEISLEDTQAEEIAINKKMIKNLLTRIFQGFGTSELSDIDNLERDHAEIAADLGKIFEIDRLIQLHNDRLKKNFEDEAERRANTIRIVEGIFKRGTKPSRYTLN